MVKDRRGKGFEGGFLRDHPPLSGGDVHLYHRKMEHIREEIENGKFYKKFSVLLKTDFPPERCELLLYAPGILKLVLKAYRQEYLGEYERNRLRKVLGLPLVWKGKPRRLPDEPKITHVKHKPEAKQARELDAANYYSVKLAVLDYLQTESARNLDTMELSSEISKTFKMELLEAKRLIESLSGDYSSLRGEIIDELYEHSNNDETADLSQKKRHNKGSQLAQGR